MAFLLGMGLGATIARLLLRSPGGMVDYAGDLPAWKVQAIVGEVAGRLSSVLADKALDRLNTAVPKLVIRMWEGSERGFSIYPTRLFVSSAPGWEARLRTALAHALHLAVYRDADPEQKDKTWFGALRSLDAHP